MDRVGRYVIEASLGPGVYAARDPELGRKVLLKLAARAGLAHPNVVPVLDAGTTDDGRDYVVLEWVEGEPFEVWAQSRSWQAVVAALIDVGRGLHAAHQAGIRHGDFQAASVVVGRDGRARVSDLGSPPKRDDLEAFVSLLRTSLAGRAPHALQRLLDRRHPSLEALLADLSRLGRRRRLWPMGAVAVALLAVAVAGSFWLSRPRLCAQGRLALWSAERRSALGKAFGDSGVPYPAWAYAEGTIDKWVRGLTAMRQEACEATEIAHTQPREALLLRERCLDERQAELASLLSVWERPTPAIVERAAVAAASLGRLSDCADVPGLSGPLRPRPEVAAEDEALRRRYAAARGKMNAGAAAHDELAAVAAEAHRLGDRSLEAQALVLCSSLEQQTGDNQKAMASVRAAVTAAEEGRDDRTRAIAWIWQIPVEDDLGSPAEARRAADNARAVLTRVRSDDEAHAQLEVAVGVMEQNSGSVEAARDHIVRGLQLAERALGPDHARLADYFSQLVMPLMILGDYDGAEKYQARALGNIEKNRGRDHPTWARQEVEAASLALARGRADEAVTLSRDALGRLERAYGRSHQNLNLGLDILNSGLRALGRLREALEVAHRIAGDADCLALLTVGGSELDAHHFDAAERALDEVVARLARPKEEGPPHVHIFKAKVKLARIYLSRKQVSRARAACEEAERGLPPNDEWGQLDSQPCLAAVEEAEHAYPSALARAEKVLAILEKNHTSEAPWGLGEQVVEVARLHDKLHHRDQAVKLLERALRGEPEPPVGVVDSMVEARRLLARLDPARAPRLTAEAAQLAAKQER